MDVKNFSQGDNLTEARRLLIGVIRRWPLGAPETSELRRALALLAPVDEKVSSPPEPTFLESEATPTTVEGTEERDHG